MYVRYFAHGLNLCQTDLVRNVMDLVYNLVQLIKFSPKRATMFETFRSLLKVGKYLVHLCRLFVQLVGWLGIHLLRVFYVTTSYC